MGAGQTVVGGLPLKGHPHTIVGFTIVHHFGQQIAAAAVVVGQLLPIIGLGKIKADLLDIGSIIQALDPVFAKNQSLPILAYTEAFG